MTRVEARFAARAVVVVALALWLALVVAPAARGQDLTPRHPSNLPTFALVGTVTEVIASPDGTAELTVDSKTVVLCEEDIAPRCVDLLAQGVLLRGDAPVTSTGRVRILREIALIPRFPRQSSDR